MIEIPMLAHGALGVWDEVLFIGVAVVFTVFMFVSYLTSRNFEPELEDDVANETDHRQ
ncbi:MAG: hypothetical protein AAFR81_29890 [Chloroflexota bacterium]